MNDWIRDHDESWLFVVLYIGFAVVLSIWISLFWLVLVVGVHFLLECVRQRMLRPYGSAVAHALWEVKLDIALVLMAFALTLYMEVVLGLVGLQSAARASAVARGGIKAGARVAGWERAIRGILLSADDVAQIARTVAIRRRAPAAEGALLAADGSSIAAPVSDDAVGAPGVAVEHPPAPITTPGAWSRGDWFALALGVASIVAIVFAPFGTSHTWATAAGLVVEQLRMLPAP